MTFREWYFEVYYPKWKNTKVDPHDVAQTAWNASNANYRPEHEEEITKLQMTIAGLTQAWKNAAADLKESEQARDENKEMWLYEHLKNNSLREQLFLATSEDNEISETDNDI